MNAIEAINELMDLMVEDRKFEAIRSYRMIVAAANGFTPGLMEGKIRIEALLEMSVTDRWNALQEEFASYVQRYVVDEWSPEAKLKRYAEARDQAIAAIMKRLGWGWWQTEEFLSNVESCVPELYWMFPVGGQA